jgi:hypothetical protein
VPWPTLLYRPIWRDSRDVQHARRAVCKYLGLMGTKTIELCQHINCLRTKNRLIISSISIPPSKWNGVHTTYSDHRNINWRGASAGPALSSLLFAEQSKDRPFAKVAGSLIRKHSIGGLGWCFTITQLRFSSLEGLCVSVLRQGKRLSLKTASCVSMQL